MKSTIGILGNLRSVILCHPQGGNTYSANPAEDN